MDFLDFKCIFSIHLESFIDFKNQSKLEFRIKNKKLEIPSAFFLVLIVLQLSGSSNFFEFLAQKR